MTRLLPLALLLLSGCAYLGRNGASLYCKDKDGKAIHCPVPKDSTKADTTRTR